MAAKRLKYWFNDNSTSFEPDSSYVNTNLRLGGCGNYKISQNTNFQSNPAQRRLFGSFLLKGKNINMNK
jgi:hypothetical protein